jgi:hypothetical protein
VSLSPVKFVKRDCDRQPAANKLFAFPKCMHAANRAFECKANQVSRLAEMEAVGVPPRSPSLAQILSAAGIGDQNSPQMPESVRCADSRLLPGFGHCPLHDKAAENC